MSCRWLKGIVLALSLSAVLSAGEVPGGWLDVPFVSQSTEGCGSASIAMVMQYWIAQGHRIDRSVVQEPAIYQALYSPAAGGILASDLERYLREHGFRVFTFRAAWTDLRHHLEKGRPLLVALRPDEGSQLHYVVVAGMDWDRGLVMINDPAGRKLTKRERRSFEQQWEAAGNWTLLALPQADAP